MQDNRLSLIFRIPVGPHFCACIELKVLLERYRYYLSLLRYCWVFWLKLTFAHLRLCPPWSSINVIWGNISGSQILREKKTSTDFSSNLFFSHFNRSKPTKIILAKWLLWIRWVSSHSTTEKSVPNKKKPNINQYIAVPHVCIWNEIFGRTLWWSANTL